MARGYSKTVAIIVAHPDDETLWTGGTILSNPEWNTFIVCLCRRDDKDRAPKFFKALKCYKSKGIMGGIDDGPQQRPMDEEDIHSVVFDVPRTVDYRVVAKHFVKIMNDKLGLR